MADPNSTPVIDAEFEEEIDAHDMLMTTERGDIDVQVATAKRYPRSVTTFMKDATSMVGLNEDIARSCWYSLPARKGGNKKPIEGPSVRFAELISNAWTNLRIEGKPVREEERYIVSRGVAWDLQSNVAKAFEVRRRITGKDGSRYGDDMIMVTGAACTAIASRNAILAVIPKAIWEPVYNHARKVGIGKADTLVARRAKMLEQFSKMNVTPEQIYAALEIKGIDDITLEQLSVLTGWFNAIKEGQSTVDEIFPGAAITPPQRKSKNGEIKPEEKAEVKTEAPAEPATEADAKPLEPATTAPLSAGDIGFGLK